jgi:hypothetical protein
LEATKLKNWEALAVPTASSFEENPTMQIHQNQAGFIDK